LKTHTIFLKAQIAGYSCIDPSGIAACYLQKESQVVDNLTEMWKS